MDTSIASPESPATWRYVVGFLLVGCAWGLTTPFIRRAAVNQKPPPPRPALTDPRTPWIIRASLGVYYLISDLLGNPAYAVPLLLNVTGSVWFFLLIGQAGKDGFPPSNVHADETRTELSLTVPITNSVAFLFTVLGEWWTERKAISRGMLFRSSTDMTNVTRLLMRANTWLADTWIGMTLVLAGIALCVHSKT